MENLLQVKENNLNLIRTIIEIRDITLQHKEKFSSVFNELETIESKYYRMLHNIDFKLYEMSDLESMNQFYFNGYDYILRFKAYYKSIEKLVEFFKECIEYPSWDGVFESELFNNSKFKEILVLFYNKAQCNNWRQRELSAGYDYAVGGKYLGSELISWTNAKSIWSDIYRKIVIAGCDEEDRCLIKSPEKDINVNMLLQCYKENNPNSTEDPMKELMHMFMSVCDIITYKTIIKYYNEKINEINSSVIYKVFTKSKKDKIATYNHRRRVYIDAEFKASNTLNRIFFDISNLFYPKTMKYEIEYKKYLSYINNKDTFPQKQAELMIPKKTIEEIINKIKNNKKQLEELKIENKKNIEDKYCLIIPTKYVFNQRALEYFIQYIYYGQAEKIGECINLYENRELHENASAEISSSIDKLRNLVNSKLEIIENNQYMMLDNQSRIINNQQHILSGIEENNDILTSINNSSSEMNNQIKNNSNELNALSNKFNNFSNTCDDLIKKIKLDKVLEGKWYY